MIAGRERCVRSTALGNNWEIVLIALVALLAWWLHRSWQLVVLVVVGLLLIVNLGYWKETTETLALVVAATVISMAIGVPVGILCAHRPWLYRAATWLATRTLGRWYRRQRWLTRLPGQLGGWTAERDFPAPAPRRFRDWWGEQ